MNPVSEVRMNPINPVSEVRMNPIKVSGLKTK